jgi:hypothetical protein
MTGAPGFIGKRFAKVLGEKEFEVQVVVREPANSGFRIPGTQYLFIDKISWSSPTPKRRSPNLVSKKITLTKFADYLLLSSNFRI